MADRLISLIAILMMPISLGITYGVGLILFDGEGDVAIIVPPLIFIIVSVISWVVTGDPWAWINFWGDMIARGGK